jgi:hypothetical protein
MALRFVSLTRQLPFTPRNIPDTHFYQSLSRDQAHGAAERIRSTEKSNDLIGNHTHDLPACSIVPQLTTIPDEAIGFFSWSNPSSLPIALVSTQPLTDTSIRNLPAGKGRPGRNADKPERHQWANSLENTGASTSHHPMGLRYDSLKLRPACLPALERHLWQF